MTTIARLLVGLVLLIPATTRCQRIVPRDSVLLSRDVDGNGRSDYVVREVKRGKEHESLVLTRTAMYLNRAPSTRKPQWASKWNDEVPIELDTVLAVPGGGSLLALGWGYGDASGTTLLLVRQSRAQELLEHTISYGNGDFRLRRRGDVVTLDASLAYLKVAGHDVSETVRCGGNQLAMAELVFDTRKEIFSVHRQYCMPVPKD